MKNAILCFFSLLLLASCKKATDDLIANKKISDISAAKPSGQITKYLLKEGQHESEGTAFKLINTNELKFTVRFDSTAIYQSITPENQYDINKLYGFSDNNALHHEFSARFGWSWNNGALRLYAYTYNNGIRADKELGIISIGAEINCSIKVTASTYIFTMNDQVVSMPRLSTTPTAQGYMLYPYFGGDETAPHNINIWIKNL